MFMYLLHICDNSKTKEFGVRFFPEQLRSGLDNAISLVPASRLSICFLQPDKSSTFSVRFGKWK